MSGKSGSVRVLADIKCGQCKTVFRPRHGKTKLCSRLCAGLAQRGHPTRNAFNKANVLSSEHAAWLAGVIDGEGSIVWVNRNRGNAGIRLTVANTCRPFLEAIVERTGIGTIQEKGVYSDKHSRSYFWTCYSASALSLIEQMLPWLIIKKERAKMAIRGEVWDAQQRWQRAK